MPLVASNTNCTFRARIDFTLQLFLPAGQYSVGFTNTFTGTLLSLSRRNFLGSVSVQAIIGTPIVTRSLTWRTTFVFSVLGVTFKVPLVIVAAWTGEKKNKEEMKMAMRGEI